MTPTSWSWWVQKSQGIYLYAKRGLAIASVVFAIYVIGGSHLFGPWWYGYFWDSGYTKTEYISDGLADLVDHSPHIALWVGIALILAILTGWLLRRWLFSLSDRFGWPIILCAITATAADALVIRQTYAEDYYRNSAAQAIFDNALKEMQSLTSPPKIEPPVYFHYLDGPRVEALYNELLPDLVVSQHEETGSTTERGKAEATAGGASVGVEAGKERGSKSVFAPVVFSPDRKCLEVMKYVQDKWPGKYYSSEIDWYARKAFAWVGPARTGGGAERWKSLLPPSTPADAQVAQQKEEARNQLWKMQLSAELGSLRGMVFIDGDLDLATSDDKAILTEKFSERAVKCSFRVSLPRSALKALPNTKPLHLRIFGEVTRPLTNGFIEVEGIAVF
ncbi:MAG: hypothetical protein WCB53_19045 [Terriglobales bacterium]